MKKTCTTRFLSLILALVLSFSLCVTAFAAGGFSDVPSSHWAYSDIMTCAEQGIVKGYEDGSFHPGDEVTTIQFLVMLTRTFYADKLSGVVTPAGQPWYYANTKVADDVGMTKNLAAVDDSPMNRYNMALVLYNTSLSFGKFITYDQGVAAEIQIKDWKTIATSYKTYENAVRNCYALGILTGMSDGTFSGEQSMIRAQACAVIVRMMNLIGDSEPAVPTTPVTPTQPEQPQQPTQPTQPETPEQTGTDKKLANGKDITSENVLEILEEIKKEYPDGTIWGKSGTANNNSYAAGNNSTDVKAALNKYKNTAGSYGLNTVTACGGWAAMVSDRIFGQSGFPAREITDASKVRAGDIIIALNANGQIVHVGIASCDARETNGVYRFTTCNGNDTSNGTGGVGQVYWGTGNATLTATRKAYTRYPD